MGVSRETAGLKFVPSDRQKEQAEQVFHDNTERAFAYCNALCTTGVDHGLVGPREVPIMWERHVLNCAVVQEAIPQGASLVDVGSGAGLPGLVLAIARPDIRVTLVEPLERRVNWLTSTIAELGLDVEVKRGRAEEFAGAVSAQVGTARAVAGLSKLVPWLAPLVAPGGTLLAIKGKSAESEIEAAQKVLRKYKVGSPEIIQCGVGMLEPPTRVVRAKLL